MKSGRGLLETRSSDLTGVYSIRGSERGSPLESAELGSPIDVKRGSESSLRVVRGLESLRLPCYAFRNLSHEKSGGIGELDTIREP